MLRGETTNYGAIAARLGSKDAREVTDAVASNAIATTAARTRQRIERVCAWVRAGMPLPAPSKTKRVRHHPALAWAEIPQFMGELRQRDSIAARALEFLILCASRTGEVRGATWDEVDAKLWTIPGGRMKGHQTHRVPLADRAVEILTALPRLQGESQVFPGTKKGAGLSNMSILELLWTMRPGLTVHGFRSTFKDWATEARRRTQTSSPKPRWRTPSRTDHEQAGHVDEQVRRRARLQPRGQGLARQRRTRLQRRPIDQSPRPRR
jgi:integrase